MTQQAPQRRGFNDVVTRFWGVAAPAYNLPFLQQWVYRPAHDEVVAQLRDHQSARVADIACGTGILADRIQRDLHPAAVYGVDMSEGMLKQAQSRSSEVHWQRGPAEQLPFDDGALDAGAPADVDVVEQDRFLHLGAGICGYAEWPNPRLRPGRRSQHLAQHLERAPVEHMDG